MDFIQIDLLTVFIAAFVSAVIRFFWYSDWLFGPFQMELYKVKPSPISSLWSFSSLLSFCNSLIIAYFLSLFEAFLGITTVTDGMFSGFLFWLGFVVTTQIHDLIWKKVPIRTFAIDAGFKLLSFLVMSGVIGA